MCHIHYNIIRGELRSVPKLCRFLDWLFLTEWHGFLWLKRNHDCFPLILSSPIISYIQSYPILIMEINTQKRYHPTRKWRKGGFISCNASRLWCVHRTKLTNSREAKTEIGQWEKKSWNNNSGAAVGTIFRICQCFQKSKQKHYTYFSL